MFALGELTTTVLTAGLALITAVVLAVLGTKQRLEVEYDIELRKRRIDAYQDDVEPHPAFIFAPERPETR